MTQAAQAPARAGGLSRGTAMTFVAFAFATTMVATTMPTPLYPLYEAQFGFGSLLVTVIYAVYAAGVLVALLLLGRSSDVLGRRPVILTALVISALSDAIFLTDADLAALFVGRVVSGLSAGIVTSAATAAIIEAGGQQLRARAATVSTAVNMLGLGCGPLLAGLLATFAPAPLRTPFIVHLCLLVPAALLIWRLRESAPDSARGTVRDALRPQRLGVDPSTRAVFVPAAIAAFGVFSVLGMFTAVEPAILGEQLHQHSHAVAGTIVFSMFAASAVSQVSTSRARYPVALPAGCFGLIAALALTAIALVAHSLPLLIVATLAIGVGHGVSFRAGMTAVTANSPDGRQAETVSAFMVIAYIAISIPVILAGVAIQAFGVFTATLVFAAVMAAVALTAAVAIMRIERRR